MKIQPPSRKDIIKEILQKVGKALTVDELVKFSGIPADKIRQTLTTWEYNIVRVAPKTYDLAERVYIGKTFRYTPEKIEVENKILQAEDDVYLFLVAAHGFSTPIIITDENNNEYPLQRAVTSKKYHFSYYDGLSKWYLKSGFQYGDDLLLTCISHTDHKFMIKREKQKDRDEFEIKVKNKKLADLVYSILSYSYTKYEDILFLFRKYLYVYPFNDPVPPDHINKALINDKRFVLSVRDKTLSWTGYPLIKERCIIGLRKYYFKNSDGVYIPVQVLRDEFGKYGFCCQCEERMVWEEDSGWRHTRNDLEWSEAYLPSSFFRIESEERIN